MDYLERLKKFNYWGPGNPPLYVSQVYYGRIIVVTVDQNEYTTSLYAQIKGGSGSSSV